jgi:hypothetical protein
VLFAVLVFGLILVLVVAARFHPGSGADLLDWDPTTRVQARMASDVDDADQLLASHNRRRRERGLPEHSEDEYRELIAEEQRRARRAQG